MNVRRRRQYPRKVVVVGATSRMAMEVSRLWVATGVRNFHLVGRKQEKLNTAAADLAARGRHVGTTCHAIDMTDPASIDEVVSQILAQCSPDVILIAHGVMHPQALMEGNLNLVQEELTVCGVSPVMWLEAFADRLSGSEREVTLAVVGSVAGDRGRRKNYLYGAGKSSIETAVEGLQNRFAAQGRVKVLLVKPGPTRTPMTSSVGDADRLADASEVAASIVRGIARRDRVIYAPPVWRWIMLIVRLIPSAVFNRLNI